MYRKLFLRTILIIAFAASLLAMIGYARGYRFDFQQRSLVPTGILVASSVPDGARVFVNGKLQGATNSNITLAPGTYTVKIEKDHYFPWEQTVSVRGELVTRTDAVLFPQNPSLSPLSSLGVVSALYFEKANKILIMSEGPETATKSASPTEPTTNEAQDRAGIYLLDQSRRPLNLFNNLRLLAAKSAFPINFNFENTAARLSPDGREVLLTDKLNKTSYLLSLDTEEQIPFNVTRSIKTITDAWDSKDKKNLDKILETFKEPFAKIASDSLDIISFSPDETKVLYRAKKQTVLPLIIKPRLTSVNQTTETRNLEEGETYVYDKKEDRNYLIEADGLKNNVDNSTIWYPDSANLIIRKDDQISVIRYDGSHLQSVYSGPFQDDFVGTTTDGRLLILANLNPQRNSRPDVYAVGIR